MRRFLVLSFSLVLAAVPATAQNLLQNSGFDSGLDGWFIFNQPDSPTVEWVADDSAGNPGSGSVSVTNEDPDAGVGLLGLFQCVPVTAGMDYRLETDVREPNGGDGQTTFSVGSAVITWFDDGACTGNDLDFIGVSTFQDRTDWVRFGGTVTAPAGAGSAAVGLWVYKDEAGGSHQAFFDDPSFAPVNSSGSCTPDATSLCLNGGRFRVTAEWEKPDGTEGQAQAVALTADTGYFWFFNENNVEVVVKVLNGCARTDHYWVFAGGLTNVEVQMRVVDTVTGAERTYTNLQTNPFRPIQDTRALQVCP